MFSNLNWNSNWPRFYCALRGSPGVRVIQRLPHTEGGPLDARMELLAGFPYTHFPSPDTQCWRKALVEALYQPTPKKGLITDLDDTLWSGISGEVGA